MPRNLPRRAAKKKFRWAVQWNIAGYYNNLPNLELLIANNPPIFLAIQEIHRAKAADMEKTLGGRYSWFTKSKTNTYQSVALGILRPFTCTRIPLETDLPIIAVRTNFPTPMSVVNIYLPSNTPNIRQKLRQVLDKIPEPRLVMSDINGWHHSWGSTTNNSQGIAVAEVVEEFNLTTLNNGSPTFHCSRTDTAIDVTWVSIELTNRLRWSVDDDLHGSDHHPIEISSLDTPPDVTRRPRWKYNEANWEGYFLEVGVRLCQTAPNSIEEFVETIKQVATQYIPKTKPAPGKKATKWWTEITDAAVKDRKKKLRTLKRLREKFAAKELAGLSIDQQERNKLENAHKEYKLARNKCRQAIRDAKNASWTEFLDSIHSDQTTAELWQRINSICGKRRQYGIAIEYNGVVTRDPQVVAEALGEYFEKISAHSEYPVKFQQNHDIASTVLGQITVPECDEDINAPFRMDELNISLGCGKGKSCGVDEVGYPLLKKLPPIGKEFLLQTLNKEWTQGTLPATWKHSIVVPIPKKEKAENAVSGFRPISLTCCPSKVLERMVNRRLTRWLEDKGLLDHRQHAFRAGRGCGSYFTDLSQIIHEGFQVGHVEVVALDLAKAYNRVWTPGVVQKLIQEGLGGNIIHFIINFLRDRTFQVAVGNERSSVRREESGVPQGSVIAVILFLVAMNSVFKVKIPKEMTIFVYADDIILVAKCKTEKALRRKVQAAVSAVVRWADNVGFKISAPKCDLLHTCRIRHKVLNTPIFAKGNKIPMRKSLRVLGVHIDRSYNFNKHIEETKKSCKSRVNLIKTISRRHKRCNRNTVLRVVEAIIVSRLTFGSEIFCTEIERVTTAMAPIYNQAIRAASGLLPSTPADAACAEGGVLPLRFILAKTICSRAVNYLEKKGNSQTIILKETAERLLQQYTNFQLPTIHQLPWTGIRKWNHPKIRIDRKMECFSKTEATNNPALIRKTFKEHTQRKYGIFCIRYTDGSKCEGRTVGFGVAGDTMLSYSLPSLCSIFSAEVAAALYAVEEPCDRPILIVTDSLSMVQALNTATSRHPWMQELQRSAVSATVMWVPSHCGIQGNEDADRNANQGRNEELATTSVPGQDLRKHIRLLFAESWAKEWQNSNSPLRKIKNDTERWDDVELLKEQRAISRLRTGVTRFSHSMTRGTPFRVQCPICQIRNSVEHVLTVCPQYSEARANNNIPDSIRDALGNNADTTSRVISFLKDVNLFFEI